MLIYRVDFRAQEDRQSPIVEHAQSLFQPSQQHWFCCRALPLVCLPIHCVSFLTSLYDAALLGLLSVSFGLLAWLASQVEQTVGA